MFDGVWNGGNLDEVGLGVAEAEAELETLDPPPLDLGDAVQGVVVGNLLLLEGGQLLVEFAQQLVHPHPLHQLLLEREQLEAEVKIFCALTENMFRFIPVFSRGDGVVLLVLDNRVPAAGGELEPVQILLLLLHDHDPLPLLDLLRRGLHQTCKQRLTMFSTILRGGDAD